MRAALCITATFAAQLLLWVKIYQRVECAPGVGQFHAAVLTVCRMRGERDHCKVVAIHTLKDEDAKRPSRERESLVGEQSRIVNRMKAALIRLGIRGFNPKLKRAAGRLDRRTPEGEPIPPNTLAELRRDMERRRLVSNQIRQIEEARLKHFEQRPMMDHTPWCACWRA